MVAFVSLNAATVSVSYYISTFSLPLALLIILSFFIGSLVGLFATIGMYWRQKRKAGSLAHRVKLAEKEIENLRVMPVKDSH